MVTARTIENRFVQLRNRRRAQEMRLKPTVHEEKLWRYLRDRRLGGHKFKRQYLIDNYIVDFVCLDQVLVVEVDGGEHDQRIEYDKKRDAYLDGLGFRVMRFWNDEVDEDIEGVLRVISMGLA